MSKRNTIHKIKRKERQTDRQSNRQKKRKCPTIPALLPTRRTAATQNVADLGSLPVVSLHSSFT